MHVRDFVWLILISVLCVVLIGCDPEGHQRREVSISVKDVIAGLGNSGPVDFWVLGIGKDGNEVRLVNMNPGFAPLYDRGRFTVLFIVNSQVKSEFYNDEDLALEALKTRGVQEFRTCPAPMQL